MDERFWRHRYRATSHAMMVTAALLAGRFLYLFYSRDEFHPDLLLILIAAGITKIGFLIYYYARE
jgi:hypothetical protein